MRPAPIKPAPGQESVWDYPRPPRLEQMTRHVIIVFNGIIIAETRHPIRILETSHPPTYYLPPEDLQREYFMPIPHSTFCEFKGAASYYTITVGDKSAQAAAWYYKSPSVGYEALKDHVAIYASRMDACYVDGELVRSQEGDFYGGWITNEIVGPFKGDPTLNTYGW